METYKFRWKYRIESNRLKNYDYSSDWGYFITICTKMLERIIKLLFSDPSEKKVKELTKLVEKIKLKEKEFEKFSEEDIKNKTKSFKKLFEWLNFWNKKDSKKIKEILDEIKCEALSI